MNKNKIGDQEHFHPVGRRVTTASDGAQTYSIASQQVRITAWLGCQCFMLDALSCRYHNDLTPDFNDENMVIIKLTDKTTVLS